MPVAAQLLLEAVKAHGHDLMRAEGRLVEPAAVAAHWHDCDYRPSLAAARDVGLAGLLDCCPEAELYLVVHRLALGAPGADCEALHGAARDAASNADVPVSRARRRARRARRA